ncbi:MAG TPA: hypothetical protein VF101_16210 [Gaiellaceae bacterium]
MELRQSTNRSRLRRRLYHRLVDPVLVWLVPALLVVLAAYALAHRS